MSLRSVFFIRIRRLPGRRVEPIARREAGLKYSFFNIQLIMAGAGGFEPPNAGTKVLCLTA